MSFDISSGIGWLGTAAAVVAAIGGAIAVLFFLTLVNQARHIVEDDVNSPSEADPQDLV